MGIEAFRKLSYGLYIVTSLKDGQFNGQVANSMFQVTSEPPTVAISINKENLTHSYIQASRKFAVSILSQNTPMTFIGLFGFKSGRTINKLEGVNYRMGKTGVPIVLEHAIAWIEADLVTELDCGTHTIFVGQVSDGNVLNNELPLTYAYYHEVKKGKSPKTAPTYVPEEPKHKAERTHQYVCSICGYIYNPEEGDPESGVKAGTNFSEVSDDWTCPICGADKSKFEIEE